MNRRLPGTRGGTRGEQAVDAVARRSPGASFKHRRTHTRLGHRRPGTSIVFIDAPTGEVVLNVGLDEEGRSLVFFHLYDSAGRPVADSGGALPFPDGLKVSCPRGEVLLQLPADPDQHIRYRLYTSGGDLLGQSDGTHTTVGPRLRVETRTLPGRPHHPSHPLRRL